MYLVWKCCIRETEFPVESLYRLGINGAALASPPETLRDQREVIGSKINDLDENLALGQRRGQQIERPLLAMKSGARR
jgi:hypothetical protein